MNLSYFPFQFFLKKKFASVIQLLLFMKSCLVPSFASPGFVNSLSSSSHLLLGLPTNLLVLIWLSSPRCQSKFVWSIFLLVGRLFYLPFATSVFCVSIQHGILMIIMCSPASLVLLLMYSIQSSSFSVESIASWNDTSLSWS